MNEDCLNEIVTSVTDFSDFFALCRTSRHLHTLSFGVENLKRLFGGLFSEKSILKMRDLNDAVLFMEAIKTREHLWDLIEKNAGVYRSYTVERQYFGTQIFPKLPVCSAWDELAIKTPDTYFPDALLVPNATDSMRRMDLFHPLSMMAIGLVANPLSTIVLRLSGLRKMRNQIEYFYNAYFEEYILEKQEFKLVLRNGSIFEVKQIEIK